MYSDKNVAELKAAADHDPNAQYLIGMHYSEGTGGVEQDWNKAVEYFHKAAERDHADAQFRLAVCYASGLGVSVDFIESELWLIYAAERGSEGAKKILNKADPSLLASVIRGEDGLRQVLHKFKWVKWMAGPDRLSILKKLRTLLKAYILENPEEENG